MPEGTALEQIIINGQEYSPEDATQLIELGGKYKKIESDLNTSLDKVYPEYTKATQKNRELEQRLADREAEFEKIRQAQAQQALEQTPEGVKKARQAARELGLADEEFLKEKGYMTRAELDDYYTEKQKNQEAGQKILSQCADLEKKIDGSDGRVPFDTEAVLFYANGKGISDIQEAYNQMNKRGNARWETEQLAKEERPGLTTLKPGGKKEPQRPRYTNDNLGQALGELINGFQQ